MMRNKASSSMQKTYDECYLICSTAVYFEGQNNEAEALRSWRSALDRIYYHNAYRVTPDYRARSETERALQDSLRDLELQCKERVALLEALRDSRGDNKNVAATAGSVQGPAASLGAPGGSSVKSDRASIGQGTVPAVGYSDLARPGPALPQRPPPPPKEPSYSKPLGLQGLSQPAEMVQPKPLSPNPVTLPRTSRTPSPEKKPRMKTTLRDRKDDKKGKKAKDAGPKRPPAASKAAGLAWDSNSRLPPQALSADSTNANTAATSSFRSSLDAQNARRESDESYRRSSAAHDAPMKPSGESANGTSGYQSRSSHEFDPYQNERASNPRPPPPKSMPPNRIPADPLPYRKEYPAPMPLSQASITSGVNRLRAHGSPRASDYDEPAAPSKRSQPPPPPVHRRPVANTATPRASQGRLSNRARSSSRDGANDTTSSRDVDATPKRTTRKKRAGPESTDTDSTPSSSGRESPEGSPDSDSWEERLAYVKKNLPKGVDPVAARQIFNEIVVQGDEVHWSDVAGLDAAKKALKEAVVYPFLRPDLFLGLREPARGMLLFGPPGTGKTMLARAVATESRATFFAISASSLTSKWLGDSERLVRALFALAKALAPSIVFVDEIDSLLAARGGSTEHETTRRLKTEFLIQWSDLQRAAAGKELNAKDQKQGDASRVLVLAATNTPWAIDEAARRRFVRRQYIPLPEGPVREEQLRTLLSHQKHGLSNRDIKVLIEVTDGYSGSDITALAKDAAMGPLRSLGEALLHMSRDEIRPIQFEDFEASLVNIRPSVGKEGLKQFEDWAKEFGERGG